MESTIYDVAGDVAYTVVTTTNDISNSIMLFILLGGLCALTFFIMLKR
jgi:hypothetical protein